MTTAVRTELTATGVAVLLAYWGQILPPKAPMPGVVCVQDGDEVIVTAAGYATREQAKRALDEAAAVCHDGGLLVLPVEGVPPHRGFVTRRRHP